MRGLGLGLGFSPLGTGTPPFSPSQLNNLGQWLDASDSETLSVAGSNVNSITDKSTNATVYGKVSDATRPTTTTVNGLGAIAFNGSTQLLRSNTVPLTGAVGDVFYVVQFADILSNHNVWGIGDTSGDSGGAAYFQLAGTDYNAGSSGVELIRTLRRIDGNILGRLNATTTELETATTYIVHVAANGTAYSISINNTAQSITVIDGSNDGEFVNTLTTADNISLGTMITSASLAFFAGTFCEGIVMDGANATEGQTEEVLNYLANKWGVTLG